MLGCILIEMNQKCSFDQVLTSGQFNQNDVIKYDWPLKENILKNHDSHVNIFLNNTYDLRRHFIILYNGMLKTFP